MHRKTHKTKTDTVKLLIVGAVGVALTAVLIREIQKPLPQPSEMLLSLEPSELAKLTLDFGNGTRREFRGTVSPDMNALSALAYATEAGNIHVTYAPTPQGVQIASIDGKKTDKKKHWVFYANGKKVGDPAAYHVAVGDEIGWKFE